MILRTRLMQMLHQMVDQLETFPEEWLEEEIYPLHKVTLVSKVDPEKRVVLVVGVEGPED